MLMDSSALMYWAEILGYVGLVVIVFVETGLFFGFILPGDSLTFVAGLLAAKGYFNVWWLLTLFIVTAFLGYLFGYWFGDKLGHWLETKRETIFYRQKYLQVAKDFYAKHGPKTILLARIVPIVRTFAPIVSGMVGMRYRLFVVYNILGAILWAGMFTLSGYYLGSRYPLLIEYLLPIAAGIILLSILPGVYAYVKHKFFDSQV